MAKVEEINTKSTVAHDFKVRSDAQFSVKSFYHTWTIANFSKCLNFSDATVYSSTFNFENANWQIMLHVVSGDGGALEEIKVRLKKVDNYESGHYVKYKFSLCDESSSLATKEGESKFETGYGWGHRLGFKYTEEYKDALDWILENDKFILHCEFLVLSCDTPKSTNASSDKKKSKVSKIDQLNSSKPIFLRYPKRSVRNMNDFGPDFLILLLGLSVFFIVASHSCDKRDNVSQNKGNAKEINELIIDTTLKVLDIANAFNLTEVKNKSLELLRSYSTSDLELLKINYADIITSKIKDKSALYDLPPV